MALGAADDNLYLLDCPGFSDTNKHKEFPNVTSILNTMKHAKSLRVTLLVTWSGLDANRGQGVFGLMRNVGALLQGAGFTRLLVCFNRVVNRRGKGHKAIASKIGYMKDLLATDQLAIVNQDSMHVPVTDELATQLINLIEKTSKEFKVIDPLNKA